MKSKHTFRLSPEAADQLAAYAARKRASQAEIVEAALLSFFSADGSERMEAAFSRRMDGISRKLESLDRAVEVGNEALALFVRSWLVATPAVPEPARDAAQAQANERFEAFVAALARRLSVDDYGQRLFRSV